MLRKWTHVMLHHSLTKDGITVSLQAIRKYHMKDMGWQDIGYHFVIELVNNEYEVMVGRDLNTHGAHCKEGDMNTKAIGVCLVGNFDESDVPVEMWKRTLRFVKSLMVEFDIPIRNVIGHRDYASYKSCPGTRFDLDKFRQEVASL